MCLVRWVQTVRMHGHRADLAEMLSRRLFLVMWADMVLPLFFFLSVGAISPLSAAAAAAAAAGRVALSGHSGPGGVLLVSNLNDEVSTSHKTHTHTHTNISLLSLFTVFSLCQSGHQYTLCLRLYMFAPHLFKIIF